MDRWTRRVAYLLMWSIQPSCRCWPHTQLPVFLCVTRLSGNGNATVDVVMFSAEVTVPAGLVDQSVWIEDVFIKKDNVIK